MKLRYNVRKHQWEACFPQCGHSTEWSEWYEYDRLNALDKIERGFPFEYYQEF